MFQIIKYKRLMWHKTANPNNARSVAVGMLLSPVLEKTSLWDYKVGYIKLK